MFNQGMHVLLVVMLALTVTASEGTLELRLESDVHTKLPALPIPVRIVAVNHGDSPVYLPGSVRFYASRGDEQRILNGAQTPWYKEPRDKEHHHPSWDPRITLAPGKTVVFELQVDGECGDSISRDPFLWIPGRYQLHVLSSTRPDLLRDFAGGGSLREVVDALPDVLISKPLTIDIREPTGVDAEAWAYLQGQRQGNHWLYDVTFGDDRPVLQTLRERFPTSQYALCVAAARTEDLSLAQLETLAAQLRAAPRPQYMLEWTELAIGGVHRSKCSQFVLYSVPRNVAAAADECEMAYAIYQRLSSTAENALVRAKAAENLANTPRRKEVYDYAAEIEAMLGRQLRPFVTCVTDTISALTVTFGYENPGDSERALPIGSSNRFAPAPESRGQPVTFLPGRHPSAVTIRVAAKRDDPARAISWSLNGMTATPKNDPKCK